YDVGREGDAYFIVMELVDGPSLAEVIADGPLPEQVAMDYAAQICNGLAYAHRAGLLHRDIKPANILVTKDDVVKLSDFGIARAVSQQTMALTKPGLVMGSVYYISPEQAQGHELHETSDLYSVGIVLYQMLTGALPYAGESPVSVALKHIGDPVPVLDAKDGVSPALGAIVNKLLQKRPENRFHSASEVATALREARERPSVAAYAIADDAPTQIHHTLPPRRSPLPDQTYTSIGADEERRSRFGMGLIAVLVTVALLATGLGYMLFAHPLPLPLPAPQITVSDYTNLSDEQAQEEAVNAGLVVRFIKSPSDTVPINHVIRQNPQAGQKVDKDSQIELVISNGLPKVGLPDVRGYNVNDAKHTLADYGFTVKTQARYDNAPKDSVIDQKPAARSQIPKGSTIALVISKGPQPQNAPSLVGLTVADAQALAQRMHFTLDTSQEATDPNVARGLIDAQDVAAGTPIDQGQTIHATVSMGAGADAQSVAVPSVVAAQYGAAVSALQRLGLRPRVGFSVQTDKNGTIVDQDPAAGTQVAPGAIVTLTESVNGEVPDTEGDTVTAAEQALAAHGYQVAKIQYTTSEGADGVVVRTDPFVGTTLAPGSSVTLIVNGSGP
ncbi:MAG TPA: PASTA domain-containing protein, partial [Candidatus Aquilonibacter sp.]